MENVNLSLPVHFSVPPPLLSLPVRTSFLRLVLHHIVPQHTFDMRW